MSLFGTTVNLLGEWFVRDDLEAHPRFKASIKNSTRATYSLANRACFYEGWAHRESHVGEYLRRKLDGKIYMVETIQVEPLDNTIEYIYLAMCNQLVTLARPDGVDADSNRVTKWDIFAENVPVFMDTTTRSLKEQNDGLIPQDITIIHIPARFGIKKLDRVYLVKANCPLGECQYYRVDSIDESLTPLDELVDRSGIDVLQLTEDKRTGDIDDGEGGGGGWWD